MHPPVTAIYAALLAFLYIRLSVAVIANRRRSKIALGTGSDPLLERAARVHANFAEYTPLALILLFLLETSLYPAWVIHSLGAPFLAARCLHAYGVAQDPENFRFRSIGMIATFLVLIVSAALLLLGFVLR